MGQVWQRLPPRSQPLTELRDSLNRLDREFGAEYLATDPLKFPHRYSQAMDIEAVAFLSATLAFGNVQSIFATLERILSILGETPHATLLNWPESPPKEIGGIYHRWVTSKDLHLLFCFLRDTYREVGTLEHYFVGVSVEEGLDRFSSHFAERGSRSRRSRGTSFLIPSPKGGSTCKRMNLFLRWMVRGRAPDLGRWKTITPSALFLPIDTHLARLVQYIGLTERTTPGWKMVTEVTERLRELDPIDPIRYDFALARLGILDRCLHRPDPSTCPSCLIQTVCILNRPPQASQHP